MSEAELKQNAIKVEQIRKKAESVVLVRQMEKKSSGQRFLKSVGINW